MRTAGVPMSGEVYEMLYIERLTEAAEASVATPADHGGWEQVEQTFQAMLDDGVRPSVPVHTQRVASHARLGRVEEAEAAFASLRAATVETAENTDADADASTTPPLLTLTELWLEQRRTTTAIWEAHKRPAAEGVTAAEEQRAAWERVLESRRQSGMKLVTLLGASDQRVHEVKFSTAVKEHVRLGRLEEAGAALELMRIAALKPSPDAFETLVIAYGRAHDWSRMEATVKVRM